MTWKVYVDTGEPEATTNELEFGTEEAAEVYARDLCSRWTLARRYFVIESWRLDDQSARIPVEDAELAAIRFGPGREEGP